MYIINRIPEKAQKEKGYAKYPDDFPHLTDDKKFIAWKNGENWEIETILSGEELKKRLKSLK